VRRAVIASRHGRTTRTSVRPESQVDADPWNRRRVIGTSANPSKPSATSGYARKRASDTPAVWTPSLHRGNGSPKYAAATKAQRRSPRWLAQHIMVRSVVMMAVLAVHLAVISGSFSGSLVGVPRMGVEPSTSVGVVILAGTEPKALEVVPVLRRVTVHLPPPEALSGSQSSTDPEGVSSASATHREPGSPPFEQLIVEAIPQDAKGLRDFCTSSYPPAARSLNEQGTVVLLVRIEADGHVSDMKVEQSSGSTRLDRVTQACVISAQFAPHRVNLRAVGSWQRIHWTWMPPS